LDLSLSDSVTVPKSTYPTETEILAKTETRAETKHENPDTQPSPVRKILRDVEETYRNLFDVAYSRQYSPTIKFSYISPPNERQIETKLIQETIEKGHGDDIFELIEKSHKSTKPIALYLPGLDGVGISATRQYDDLSEKFELWRMVIDCQDDRSTFTDLTTAASTFIRDVTKMANKGKSTRELTLIGESFGGLLAPSVAIRVKTMHSRITTLAQKDGFQIDTGGPVKGMVLVNPATSFDETQWSTFAPLLACLRYLEGKKTGSINGNEEVKSNASKDTILPTPYSVVGGMALSAVIPDFTQLRQILSTLTSAPVTTAEDAADILTAMRLGRN